MLHINIKIHNKFFKSKSNVEVDEENNKLPICKPSCKAVTAILKLMYKQIETYNSKSNYFSRFKSFWLVPKQPVSY